MDPRSYHAATDMMLAAFSTRCASSIILFLAAFGLALAAHAAETGYVVEPSAGGVRISIGPVPADQPRRLNAPLRLGPLRLGGLPVEIRAVVTAQVRAQAPHEGTVGDLFAAAQILEAALRNCGYALARAYVPPQRLRDGEPARIEVIDVRIEALDLESLPAPISSRVTRRMAAFIDRPFLRTAELTRALGLLQLDTGMPFKIDPVAGSSGERLKLRVTGPTKSWIADASVGGLTSRPFAHILSSAAVTMVLPDDQGRITVAGSIGRRAESPDTSGPLGTALVVWSKPLDDANGAFAELGVIGLRLRSQSPVTTFANAYDYGRVLWRLGQPLILRSDESLIVKFGSDVTAESFRVHGLLPYDLRDETMGLTGVTRAEAIWVRQFFPGLSLEANLTGTVGITQAGYLVELAGDRASERQTHAIGILSARARAIISLPLDFGLTILARGQYSGLGPLPLSEQFQLFRAGEIVGYDPETDQGDSGATVRAEFGRTFAWPWAPSGTSLTPYVFGGRGFLNTSGISNNRVVTGSTWGVGSRIAFPAEIGVPARFTLGVELYRQTSSGTIPNYTGLSLNLSTKF